MSRLGMREAEPLPPTARCFAWKTIGERAGTKPIPAVASPAQPKPLPTGAITVGSVRRACGTRRCIAQVGQSIGNTKGAVGTSRGHGSIDAP